MRNVARWTMVALMGWILAAGTGCAFEEGARDGIIKGTSAAVSAVIQDPIKQLLGSLLPD